MAMKCQMTKNGVKWCMLHIFNVSGSVGPWRSNVYDCTSQVLLLMKNCKHMISII